jgi:hypothetical protein
VRARGVARRRGQALRRVGTTRRRGWKRWARCDDATDAPSPAACRRGCFVPLSQRGLVGALRAACPGLGGGGGPSSSSSSSSSQSPSPSTDALCPQAMTAAFTLGGRYDVGGRLGGATLRWLLPRRDRFRNRAKVDVRTLRAVDCARWAGRGGAGSWSRSLGWLAGWLGVAFGGPKSELRGRGGGGDDGWRACMQLRLSDVIGMDVSGDTLVLELARAPSTAVGFCALGSGRTQWAAAGMRPPLGWLHCTALHCTGLSPTQRFCSAHDTPERCLTHSTPRRRSGERVGGCAHRRRAAPLPLPHAGRVQRPGALKLAEAHPGALGRAPAHGGGGAPLGPAPAPQQPRRWTTGRCRRRRRRGRRGRRRRTADVTAVGGGGAGPSSG